MPVLEPAQVAPVKEVGEDPVTLRVPRSGRAVGSRRKDILQTLAKLLEDPQCDRITTALIAKKLKLSGSRALPQLPVERRHVRCADWLYRVESARSLCADP